VVHPSVPARSIKELIALAKANPGKLNYASGGEGGINHLPAEMFNHMAGVRLVHIPYKGAGPALAALLGGEVQLMIATLGSCLPHVRTGKLRDLAIAGERRSSLVPQVPTVAEAGVPGYAADSWYGLVAPRGTPPEIVNLLNREIAAALDREEVRAQFVALGFEPASSTPAQFADYLKSEIVKWGRVIKESGISKADQ
jgi:tripartite-type tricarboxylate transporter receptor subunit TctC